MKKIYDSFLENGDFEFLFPSLSGNYKKDKEKFKKLYEEIKRIENNL